MKRQMNKRYFAHSGNNPDKSDWQPLSEHLHHVADLAASSAKHFKASQLAQIAGLLHDAGKYSEAFAQRLEGGKRVDHATAGAKIAIQQWERLGKIIAYIVAGHHAGLANGVDLGDNRATLEERLKKDIPLLDEAWKQALVLPDQLPFPPHKPAEKSFHGFQLAFLIRMLYSCLVDADFIDTERFYRKLEGKTQNRSEHPPLQKLQVALDKHLTALQERTAAHSPSAVNDLRKKVLEYARKQAQSEPGLFSLTVPTGGGKTLTSMAFALDHALKHQLRRVIYVIPFTSIIEQNAKVFRDLFGEFGNDIVLEHHSAFDDAGFDWREETKDKLRLAMENWDAPIVVTTAVQFFESLFADRSSKCRKLHNISGSVIILDEAQMMPQKLLRPTMAAIDELARNYNCSVVLCTATQPALLRSDEFHNGFQNVREIAPDPARLYRKLDRVTVRHIGIQTDEDLAERIAGNIQILIIVNNRRHARALFELTDGGDSHYHLTTLMCAKHRKMILEEIRIKLKSGEPCKVISTSLIEAGVDVDFPMVMRAEGGLDSVAQAAGRCNREGGRAKEDSELLIFITPDWKAPPELEQAAACMRQVVRNHSGDLLASEAIKAYFRDLFWRNDAQLDSKKILNVHRDHCQCLSFPFQNIARDYRIIESHLHPIIIPYDSEAEKWIERLHHAEFVGRIAGKLQQYLVQVPKQAFIVLKTAGVIVAIQPERFGDQFWKLNNQGIYDEAAGLNWENPTYIKAEATVIS
ncbi:MAG: CRISPR-associated helicase Cas3' [Candidatus Thiodiazotropha sp. (ex Dulcina madagascariensis)]|nr:CRISPR-associated helicase Cas3' [Candidatus Thiodiazotropha sp. (ex Dulcina madagascariensis)]